MTTPSEQLPQPPHPTEPPDPRHGIVDELKHDVHGLGHVVEQAVDRVPTPVRWTVRKLMLIGALAFAASLTVIFWSSNRSYRYYGPSVEPRFPTPKG